MDNKITISILASALSQVSGKSKKLCEDFIKEFFKLAAEEIEKGETLRIKGFGTFKIVEVEARMGVNVHTGEKQEIAAYRKAVFTPSKELAAAINAPFEDFESVEMDDDIPEEILLQDETLSEEADSKLEDLSPETDENEVSELRLEQGSEEEGEDDEITYAAYKLKEEEEAEDVSFQEIPEDSLMEYDKESELTREDEHEEEPEEGNNLKESEEAAEETDEENSREDESEEEDEDDDEREERYIYPVYDEEPEVKSRFGMGFLVGSLSTFAVCAIIFMLGCFFDWWPVNFNTPDDVAGIVEQPLEEVPSEEASETPEVEEAPVYDTVSTTRYLTTIAREHYGDFNFWPYIYLENEKILGHPDRITPGTQVVVPPLSKYGVDPANKEDVSEAKKKAAEIYARFK